MSREDRDRAYAAWLHVFENADALAYVLLTHVVGCSLWLAAADKLREADMTLEEFTELWAVVDGG